MDYNVTVEVNGCFEKYASMKAFKEMISKEYKVKDLSGQEIAEFLIKEKDTDKCKKLIDEYINNLSIGLANLINIFEPETISIGGSFVFFKDLLMDKLKDKLNEEGVLFNKQAAPKIILAKLKNDAGIIGSVIEYNE